MIDCKLAIGVCEDRMDPLEIGRCRVRIFGLHTSNKQELPTEMLPWAHPIMPINGASISGIGWSPTGIVTGSIVLVTWLDECQQQPIMLGTIGGIPQTATAQQYADEHNEVILTDSDGSIQSSSGNPDVEDTINDAARSLVDFLYNPNGADEELPVETDKNKLQLIRKVMPDSTVENRIINPSTGRTIAIGKDVPESNYSMYKLTNPSKWNKTLQDNFNYEDRDIPGKYKQWTSPDNVQQETDKVILEFFETNFMDESL